MATKGLLAVLLVMSLLPSAARPAEPRLRVVASIPPVHSLVSAVTEGVVTPVLILPGNTSPHFHQLRPSQARALQDAEVVFWLGAGMESFPHARPEDAWTRYPGGKSNGVTRDS